MAVDGYILEKTGGGVDETLRTAMIEGESYVTAGKALNTTVGQNSTAEGAGNTVTGEKAHGEGANNKARAYATHVEGYGNDANGMNAHAEGRSNTVTGSNAHVEGTGNIANHKSQHVFGEYNVADDSAAAGTERGNYAEIVGNGESDSNRSNIRTLDWNGNEQLAGKLTLGKDPENDNDAATLKAVKEKVYDSLITESVTGNPIEITDGANNVPLKSALLKGKTAAVNQLVENGDFAVSGEGQRWNAGTGAGASLNIANNEGSWVTTGTNIYTERLQQGFSAIANHSYLLSCEIYVDSTASPLNVTIALYNTNAFVVNGGGDVTGKVWTKVSSILTPTTNDTNRIGFGLSGSTTTTVGTGVTVKLRRCMCIDLTLCGFTSSETADVATLKAAWLNKYGTPLPSSIPYNAGQIVSNNAVYQLMGHNIWDEITETGGINDTTGADATANNQFRSDGFIPCKPNTNYYICCTTQTTNVYVYFYDANKAFISRAYLNGYNVANKEIATPNNCVYMRIKVQKSGGSTTYDHDIAINYPATVTTYEPSHDGGSIVADSLNGIGTVADEQDEQDEQGNITRRFAVVDLGTLNWTYASNRGGYMWVELPLKKKNTPMVCARYKYIGVRPDPTYDEDKVIALESTATDYIDVHDTAYTDAATFKTAMSGVYLAFELATPTTDTTTPATLTTQKGYNILRTVSGDVQSGDATLEYRADTVLYIQKMINNG